MNTHTALVQTLWNYCSILHDDGLSFRLFRDCGGQDYDYVEQLIPPLAGLLLKMADEQSRPPFNAPSPTGYGGTGKPSAVPKEVAWPSLLARARQLPFFKAFTRGPL